MVLLIYYDVQGVFFKSVNEIIVRDHPNESNLLVTSPSVWPIKCLWMKVL